MSDSDSDMPEAVSFQTAKKNISSHQKDLNKAALLAPKKKRVRKNNENENDSEDEGKTVKSTGSALLSKRKNLASSAGSKQSASAKVDQNLMNLITEELPVKKLKQIEGKFKVVQKDSKQADGSAIEPKRVVLKPEVQKAKKLVAQGVQVVFSKEMKSKPAVSQSARSFLAQHSVLSNSKRQPISRIIGCK